MFWTNSGKISAAGIILALALTGSAAAEVKIFEQNVVIVMGRRESMEDVSVFALQEAKRLVLEKVGTYLTGSTDIVQRVRESGQEFTYETTGKFEHIFMGQTRQQQASRKHQLIWGE